MFLHLHHLSYLMLRLELFHIIGMLSGDPIILRSRIRKNSELNLFLWGYRHLRIHNVIRLINNFLMHQFYNFLVIIQKHFHLHIYNNHQSFLRKMLLFLHFQLFKYNYLLMTQQFTNIMHKVHFLYLIYN